MQFSEVPRRKYKHTTTASEAKPSPLEVVLKTPLPRQKIHCTPLNSVRSWCVFRAFLLRHFLSTLRPSIVNTFSCDSKWPYNKKRITIAGRKAVKIRNRAKTSDGVHIVVPHKVFRAVGSNCYRHPLRIVCHGLVFISFELLGAFDVLRYGILCILFFSLFVIAGLVTVLF